MKHFMYFVTILSAVIIVCVLGNINSSAASIVMSPDTGIDVNTPRQLAYQRIGEPSPYYVEFYITLSGYSEVEYLIIYLQNDVTFNLPQTASISAPWSIPASAAQYCEVNKPRNNWNVIRSQNSFTNAGTIWNSSVNSTFFLINNTIPVSFAGQTINPPVDYVDDFYCYRDNYNIQFGVSATLNSQFYEHIFVSQEYDVTLKINRGNCTYYYTIPSYSYISSTLVQNIVDGNMLSHFSPNMKYYDRMRSVKLMKYEWVNAPADTDYSLNNSVTFSSENVITLNNLLVAMQEKYPNEDITYNDLYSVITVEFHLKSNGNLKESFTVDFSEFHTTNTADAEEPPPDDIGIPDQTDPFADLNNYLASNNYYLDLIKKGDTYISNGMSQILQDAPTLNDFATPDYQYQKTTLDTDAMGFFSRMVTWWWDSPFGIIAIVALTFLVVKTIIW